MAMIMNLEKTSEEVKIGARHVIICDNYPKKHRKCCTSELIRGSKRRVKNKEFKKIGRNKLCFCGSGKKFKRCCISKEYIESTHIDICTNAHSSEEIVSSCLCE